MIENEKNSLQLNKWVVCKCKLSTRHKLESRNKCEWVVV